MKKTAIILLLTASFLFAQNYESNQLVNLKQQINIQNSGFSMKSNANPGRKSTGLAVLYSLLLPGMGELYAGDYSTGKYFTIAEAALWGMYAGFTTYGNNQRDNYISFAQTRGGVSSAGKEDQFWADISGYIDIEQFNREKDLNREFNLAYDPATHLWDWKTNDARREYRNLWTSSEQALNNVRFVVWGMLINRVVSAVNAVRLVVRHNKNLEEGLTLNVSVGVFQKPNLPSGMQLNFQTRF